MQCLKRNKQKMYYATFQCAENETDADGLITPTRKMTYSDPVEFYANFAQSKKRVELEAFGIREAYDGTFVTADMDCPIKEDSIMWIGKEPFAGGTLTPHNYVVVGRFPTPNFITYAVNKVVS